MEEAVKPNPKGSAFSSSLFSSFEFPINYNTFIPFRHRKSWGRIDKRTIFS
jgi:hypothetical protein